MYTLYLSCASLLRSSFHQSHAVSDRSRMQLLLLLLPLALALAMPPLQLELLETNEDFVLGSSCAVEAVSSDGVHLDEAKAESCWDCFAWSTTVAAAKACVTEYLPNIYSDCREEVEARHFQESVVLQCFIHSVKLVDTDGELRQKVKQELGLNAANLPNNSHLFMVLLLLHVLA